ncbi:MAG: hypothetical protein PUH54_00790 [Oscillospiraceae bacterium]|nr:hypothetical protein [Oscillospiraceae bacterium]
MKKISALLMALTVLVLSVSCSSSKNSESVIIPEESQTTTEIPESIEKPVLKISETEISYSELDHENGTVVPVEYSVSGIVNGWSSSGIHIAFDDRLDLKTDDLDGSPNFERGEASQYISSVISIRWQGENPPDELDGKNMDNLTMITADSSNSGYNGVIASIDFIVPPDAKAGDVYNIEFFRYKTDCFRNIEFDSAMEEYAFANWQNGYIKITE